MAHWVEPIAGTLLMALGPCRRIPHGSLRTRRHRNYQRPPGQTGLACTAPGFLGRQRQPSAFILRPVDRGRLAASPGLFCSRSGLH